MFKTFKIKTGYKQDTLPPETIKFLGSTKSKITKNENGEIAPNLEINEIVLIYSNTVNDNDHQN